MAIAFKDKLNGCKVNVKVMLDPIGELQKDILEIDTFGEY